jgi:hypothetical protein
MKRLVFLLAVLFPLAVLAQDGRQLMPKIDEAIAANAPEWKVDHKSGMDRGVMMEWSSDKGPARLVIMIADSRSQARDWFRRGARDTQRAIKPNGLKRKLRGFGDEAYIATEYMKPNWVTICFRRGRLYAQVLAPTKQSVTTLAQLIAKEVGAT